jgi:hypothetical protein
MSLHLSSTSLHLQPDRFLRLSSTSLHLRPDLFSQLGDTCFGTFHFPITIAFMTPVQALFW